MALNLNDNKRPYFKQLGLDETFDEIQSAVNAIPSPSYVEVDLTPAQILTLGTSPVTILAAPGAGSYNEIIRITLEYTFTSGFGYNMAGDALTIRDGAYQVYTLIAGSLIGETNSKAVSVTQLTAFDGGLTQLVVAPQSLNTALVLNTFNEGAITDNSQTGTLKVKIWYNTVSI